jgi:hypothetical protein
MKRGMMIYRGLSGKPYYSLIKFLSDYKPSPSKNKNSYQGKDYRENPNARDSEALEPRLCHSRTPHHSGSLSIPD